MQNVLIAIGGMLLQSAILNAILGVTGLEWVQPVADIISLLMAIALYVRTLKKLSFFVQTK